MKVFVSNISLAIILFLVIHSPSSASPGEGTVFDPYIIPPDKSVLERCRQTALAEHPGLVTAFQIRNTIEGFHYQFDIKTLDGTDWIVVCEGTGYKVLRSHPKD